MKRASKQLTALTRIMKAKESVARSKLASISKKEERIRKLLSDLNGEVQNGKEVATSDIITKQIGLDTTWLQWANERRRALNLQLAQVLVHKEAALGEMQKAIGQSDAVDGMVQKQTAQIQSRLTNLEQDHLLALAIFETAKGRS